MIDGQFFNDLGAIVVAAAVLVVLGRLIRMPAIVVYLFAGLMIGPAFGWVEMSDGLKVISEKGIALLLFLVGLELSFAKIRDVGKVAIMAGIGQVVFTAAGGYVLCWTLGFPLVEALFLAIALTFSSTVVVVKLLDEKGELNSLYGRIAVGIFLVQDLVVIVILTFLAGISGAEEMDAGGVMIALAKAFGGMILLLVFALAASRYVLPRPFRWASRSPEMLLVWALTWCFILVWAAHAFGLSLEVGAFLAGISLAQLPYNDDLRRRVHPLMNLFIAVFFVSLGVRMDLGGAIDQWWPTLVLTVFVLIGNPFIFILIITRMGYRQETSFLTSVTVAQISEFSFIFAGMGLASGLIGGEILSITALVGVLTIAISAFMIIHNRRLYSWVDKLGLLRWRIFRTSGHAERGHGDDHELSGHIIVVGMNTLGRELVRRLHQRGELVLAIDTDPEKLSDLPAETLLGSVEYASVLDEAQLAKARLLVSALRIEAVNQLLAYRCQGLGVPSAIHVTDLSVVEGLLELDVDFLMISRADGLKAQLAKLEEMGVIGR
ncbi:cation:proton antiporter [Sulfuriroseicoccus oceanibius]|uniref:Cation:proton antiporter n=1 Tax=Sulfuriroseicoccus oceanibius TaxID=2707525 RepID=A0A6B3LCX4_9BACT|nr:cation:proton antiporter [Sulfuriroseicoccus oceanibius]QQL44448.1 cation:proton antiporter [Sulfuriroseicoccus oceanibius]